MNTLNSTRVQIPVFQLWLPNGPGPVSPPWQAPGHLTFWADCLISWALWVKNEFIFINLQYRIWSNLAFPHHRPALGPEEVRQTWSALVASYALSLGVGRGGVVWCIWRPLSQALPPSCPQLGRRGQKDKGFFLIWLWLNSPWNCHSFLG